MNIISGLPSPASVAVATSVVRVNAISTANAHSEAATATQNALVPAVAKAGKPSADELNQAVEQANKILQTKTSNELQFSIDKDSGLSVVRLINQQSGDTVLQFPSEAMIQIAKSIDRITGAIIRKQA